LATREQIERLIAMLPRLGYGFDTGAIPTSGLYFFFEETEPPDQIVRIGTHLPDGRLRKRLSLHFGRVGTLDGNRRVSVFRRHLGGALLHGDARQSRWLDRSSGKMPDVEMEVSQILRTRFEFSVLSVPERDERLAVERALIGTLARDTRMSEAWLGQRAAAAAVRQSGLWNVEHVTAVEPVDLLRLTQLVERTLKGEWA
jgi:hypothetical protein